MAKEIFNSESRTENARKASILGVCNQLSKIVLSFVYRTVFLFILSKEYLGLEGLFTNILNILQLAELGIGTAIVFRMYRPIKEADTEKVAAIMHFYKWVYRAIALIVLAVGLAILPFLDFFIKDTGEIPQDINIKVLYLLFLAQSVASYLFVYKQSILTADQKNYSVSIFSIIATFVKHGAMLAILAITKNYTLTLGVGIAAVLSVNFVLSLVVQRRYKEVFKLKNRLSKEEMKTILKDTGAMLCHKIGWTVVYSTDSLLVSKFIGTGALGIYSNYSLIIYAVSGLMTQLLGSFVSSLGNMSVSGDDENKMRVYKRLLFFNHWFVSLCTVCLFVLLNPFILVWQDESMLLPMETVIALSASFFMTNSKVVTNSYITASGLFTKDKLRPLIEAALNLGASILLVNVMGITGIFVGTIISGVLTSWWREPYILHKFELHASSKFHWFRMAFTICITAISAAATYFLCTVTGNGIGGLVLKFLICAVLPNLILLLSTFYTDEFKFFFNYLKTRIMRVLRKSA